MAWLKYYEIERAKYPELQSAECSMDEAVVAIKKLCRHFKVRPPTVSWTSGRRYSRGGSRKIILNTDHLNWRVVLHEFAHCMHDQHRYKWPNEKIRWHGKRHRKLMERCVNYCKKKRWESGSLLALFAPKKEKAHWPQPETVLSEREKLMERETEKAMERESKIYRREKQVLRLERRIKALSTRLKKASRSLAALRRAKEKQLPQPVVEVEEKMAAAG